MFFSAYIGGTASHHLWRLAVERYAAALQMRPVIMCKRVSASMRLMLAWVGNCHLETTIQLREEGPLVMLRTSGTLSAEELSVDAPALKRTFVDDWASRDIRILVDLDSAGVVVTVPPATPEQFCWARINGGYVFANDARLFPHLRRWEIDPRAVYALFQYGLIPAPLTMFCGVSRVPGGHVFELGSPSADCRLRPLPPPDEVRGPALTHPDPLRWIADTLDGILERVPANPVLYFSGGVDSTLLASRLVRLGRSDVQLVNYSFGPDDPESLFAMKVARHFDLPCAQVLHNFRKVADVLERVGADYSFPFGDFSTVPTNILVHESTAFASAGTTVIEGTGADGAFGLAARYPTWRRVYTVPSGIRRGVAVAFRQTRLWQRDSTPTRLAGFITRSAHLPLELAVIAQNPLDGVAYHTPPAIRDELSDVLLRPVRRLSSARGEADLSLLDMTMVCAGTMAAKSFDPLRRRAFNAVYPYLDPAMTYGASCLPPEAKAANGIPKSHVKRLLAADIPTEWIHRPKSGFTPPYRDLFAVPTFQEHLRYGVLGARNPLLSFIDTRAVTDLLERTRRRARVTPGVHDFLWAVAFASSWVATATVPPACGTPS